MKNNNDKFKLLNKTDLVQVSLENFNKFLFTLVKQIFSFKTHKIQESTISLKGIEKTETTITNSLTEQTSDNFHFRRRINKFSIQDFFSTEKVTEHLLINKNA